LPRLRAGLFKKMKRLRKYFLVLLLLATAQLAVAQRQINIADPRLDFTLTDVNGNPVTLSSMKGKVFLLDFWASWCAPCRYSNKELVKIYSKYKDKGFEILGVSLDDNFKAWKRAIKRDRLTWKQVNDPNGWDAQSAIQWNVIAIPSSFLIDKDGNVVAIDPEKGELENKLRQLLGL